MGRKPAIEGRNTKNKKTKTETVMVRKKFQKVDYLAGQLNRASMGQLQAFHACVYFGTRTLAAHNLGISEAAVSIRLFELETSLKIKLFNRKPSGFSLTCEGELLYPVLDNIFNELTLANSAMKGKRILEKITVYTTIPLGLFVLTDAFLEFKKKYPTVDFSIKVDSTPPDLKLGGADIVIWTTDCNNKHFTSETVGVFTSKLYASESYLEQKGIPTCVEDLKHHNMIAYEGGEVSYDINWHTKLTRMPPMNIIKTNSSVIAIKMCELGGGITLYSPSMVSRAGLNLRNVLPELSKETAPVKFIHHVSLKENEQIQFLMAAVEAAIQKLDHE
jgi:DNA-binding transcriptional LysR family regulator